MRSRVVILQNHCFKNDVSFMDDEPEEPERKEQQEIIQEIGIIVVEHQLKQKFNNH